MGLVEGVPGEGNQNVPDGLGGLPGVSVLLHTLEEGHLLLGQDLGLLLAHGSTEHISLAQGVSCQDSRGRLDLLLVDDQTVGLVQDRLEGFGHLGMDGFYLLLAVLALGVVDVGVHIHGPRPVQGDQGGYVVEVIGLEHPQEGPHPVTIELEDAQGIAPG